MWTRPVPRAGLGPAAVVAAGAALADEVGFAGLSMGQLAERVGVRTPSLYKHIGGQDDLNHRIAVAVARLTGSLTAVLRAYPIRPDDMDHALRAVRSFFHGFATLQAADGFQWATDIDDSYEWLITLLDRGLRYAPAR